MAETQRTRKARRSGEARSLVEEADVVNEDAA